MKRNGGQWLLGKAFPTFAPIGPAITTLGAGFSDAHKTGIRCFLNGDSVQDSNTDQLVFKTEAVVSWVSQCMKLYPGDIIFTGTPPGVGCFRKPKPLWLKEGDSVVCEIVATTIPGWQLTTKDDGQTIRVRSRREPRPETAMEKWSDDVHIDAVTFKKFAESQGLK